MTPFGRCELVSQIPKEGWLLSNHQESYSSVGGAHFCILALVLPSKGSGFIWSPSLAKNKNLLESWNRSLEECSQVGEISDFMGTVVL